MSELQVDEPLIEGNWASQLADHVLRVFPNEPLYTCAAGISPSGVVHFGNFRDVVTSMAVASELRNRGKQVRFLFSWDNYDRFRKVPADVDPAFSKYIGMPLTSVPDPWQKADSYAAHFQSEFESTMRELGITLDYRYQTKEYISSRYAPLIARTLKHRVEIAEILLSFKTDKGNQEKGIDPDTFRETFFPVAVYSRFTGKDKTEVLACDGTKLTYRCLQTGNEETIDFAVDPIVKLHWKVDWAMRWSLEKVHFEPGGKDHASPGSSYDVSSVLIRKIFGAEPPVFQGYEFVGVQGIGGKMSGSKGGAIPPATLLEIYEPELLKWLYLRRAPTQSFNLAFDTEIYRQYDEFDRAVLALRDGVAAASQAITLTISGVDATPRLPPLPFKQAVALGQIVHWNAGRVGELLTKLGTQYDQDSIVRRLPKARAWLERYNPDEIIQLRESLDANTAASLAPEARERVSRLASYMKAMPESVTALEEMVYAIPKDPTFDDKQTKLAQRAFFKDVYQLLIGKDTGPRLSTFLWAADRGRVVSLLDIGA